MPPSQTQNSFSGLLASGDYSDCTLRCKGTEYRLHKAMICPRSSFFEAAFQLKMKEKHTGIIDLPEDDPELVGYMVYFLYHGHYNSRTKTHDGREDATLEQHALVYALADKYGIPTLKNFASERFAFACLDSSQTEDFALVIKTVYRSTPEGERALRDIVVSTLILNHKLLDGAVVQEALLDTQLAYDVVMAGHAKMAGKRNLWWGGADSGYHLVNRGNGRYLSKH